MDHSIDFHLLAGPMASLSAPHMFLRIINTLVEGSGEDFDDHSHLPVLSYLKEFVRRTDNVDLAVSKYCSKISDSVAGIDRETKDINDEEQKKLVTNLMKVNKKFAEVLTVLQPLIRDQKQAMQELNEYICPPTAELFKKKAYSVLKDSPVQEVSSSKKNNCTICLENTANCIIKRSCAAPSSSRPHCEQDTCKCGPTMCKDCLLTHYWTSTNRGSKSYSRCVCCRAEFCLKDVYPVEYVEPKPNQTSLSHEASRAEEPTCGPSMHERKEKGKSKDVGSKPGSRGTAARDVSSPSSNLSGEKSMVLDQTRSSRKKRRLGGDEEAHPLKRPRREDDEDKDEDYHESRGPSNNISPRVLRSHSKR